ncbi:MAG: MgtC/SapB family protein, partial [Ignavibacteriaceae bacterium]
MKILIFILPVIQDSIKFLPDYLSASKTNFGEEDLFIIFQKLIIAVLIGVLIGLEREHSKPENEKTFAGVRTFPLISILGFTAALISSLTSFWIYFAVFIGYSSLITAAYVFSAKYGRPGGTTEVSTILVFILGSLVYWNYVVLAAIIAVIVATFLTLKIQLHRFVGKVSEEDLYATIKLAIISVIILPLLPNKVIGPLNILNPQMIWLMVIFISGISFIGYIFVKVFGQNKGIPITGLMGGLVSSTAVSYSFSKKSKENNASAKNFALGILLASTVMFPRIFVVILVLNSALIKSVWIPLLILTFVNAAVSYFMFRDIKYNNSREGIDLKNPFKLKSALLFGLIFAIMIFLSKAAQLYMGKNGVYAASAFGGLASIDAIIVSLTQLSYHKLNGDVIAIAVIIVVISNSVFKGIIALIWGTRELSKQVIKGLGYVSLTGVAYLIYIILR